MKTPAFILVVSLALNAVALTQLFRHRKTDWPASSGRAPGSAITVTPSEAGVSGNSELAPRAAKKFAREPLLAGAPPDDIGEVIARLRAAGFPAREIVAVVQAMIDEIERQRRLRLGLGFESRPYWATVSRADPKQLADEMRSAGQEARRLARTYLYSPDLFAANDSLLATQRRRFGPLDVEKLRQLTVLDADYRDAELDQLTAIMANGGGMSVQFGPAASDQTKRKAFDDSVRALLTADEYRDYQLRSSDLALSLQGRLDPFRPSEQEFKAIYAVEQEFRFSSVAMPTDPAARQAAAESYAAAIRRALGPERAADYEALQHAGGDVLPRLMARLDLPLAAITPINAIRDQTNAQAKLIRGDPGLNTTQRAERLASLAREAEAQLGAIFGDSRGLDAYKDAKGVWLRALQSEP